jgi:SPP1 gp7 family putative phage head morphogenesis protein
MPDAQPFSLPFDEAIAYLAAKGIELSPEDWRDIWAAAHARAFTVARVTAADVLVDLREAVDRAIADGQSLHEFKKAVRELLERKGWFAPKGEKAEVQMPDGTIRKRLTSWRVENIYRTNMQTAYAVGRYQQMLETAVDRPYWQYKAIMDSRTRPAHAAMHNKVYDYRHPVWDTWYPPNGFGCRCYIKSLSADDVADRGLKPETGGVKGSPDEGWDYNVGAEGLAAYRPDLTGYPDEIGDRLRRELGR